MYISRERERDTQRREKIESVDFIVEHTVAHRKTKSCIIAGDNMRVNISYEIDYIFLPILNWNIFKYHVWQQLVHSK